MEQVFIVENIKCGGCMNSIKTALQKISGVSNVDINQSTDSVIVSGNADKSEILNKLNVLGYPEKGNNSMVKKAKSYLNCAIGRMND
jgi:copper chaperone CopZ